VVNAIPQPLYTQGRDLVPIVQEAGWGPKPVWTGKEILSLPCQDAIPGQFRL